MFSLNRLRPSHSIKVTFDSETGKLTWYRGPTIHGVFVPPSVTLTGGEARELVAALEDFLRDGVKET